MLVNAISLLDDAVKEVRSVSHNMMANQVVKAGLKGAIEDFATKFSNNGKFTLDLEIVGLDERLEPSSEVVIFRAIQEIFNNIIKNSEATKVTAQLIRHPE